jgi:hypothetical protein
VARRRHYGLANLYATPFGVSVFNLLEQLAEEGFGDTFCQSIWHEPLKRTGVYYHYYSNEGTGPLGVEKRGSAEIVCGTGTRDPELGTAVGGDGENH